MYIVCTFVHCFPLTAFYIRAAFLKYCWALACACWWCPLLWLKPLCQIQHVLFTSYNHNAIQLYTHLCFNTTTEHKCTSTFMHTTTQPYSYQLQIHLGLPTAATVPLYTLLCTFTEHTTPGCTSLGAGLWMSAIERVVTAFSSGQYTNRWCSAEIMSHNHIISWTSYSAGHILARLLAWRRAQHAHTCTRLTGFSLLP